jgi:antitoxin component YwqK of YwqJK toxin-antitoxin module
VKWYGNGKIMEEGFYRVGVRHGPFIKWSQQGQKLSEGEYADGKLVKEKVY